MIKRTLDLKEAFDFASKYVGFGEVKIKKMGSLFVVTVDRQAELKQKIDALESMINEYQINHCKLSLELINLQTMIEVGKWSDNFDKIIREVLSGSTIPESEIK